MVPGSVGAANTGPGDVYGSMSPARWPPCFALGNVPGITGTWFMMLLCTRLNANVGLGLAGFTLWCGEARCLAGTCFDHHVFVADGDPLRDPLHE
jgi:hypothetical protein